MFIAAIVGQQAAKTAPLALLRALRKGQGVAATRHIASCSAQKSPADAKCAGLVVLGGLKPPHAHQRCAFTRVQSRSRSLMLVLARVSAVTCLTITAQYRLWLPSLAGMEPLTTTEPEGMRP